ncbi:AMP-binding protein [Kurthia sibirica]|uniref:AMP-binding protein n=1 Tax=Kurthia sibirica TaxID=202750 RepID=A0A2U3AIN1_9BACL|nr:AMP-binding protein [Kurthia sibirica]PWI24367.1 hypothetical protein DEX24_13605 [Kurthia sibirica]GEK33784.1 AMP-binding protein [Kurthia sibirica]
MAFISKEMAYWQAEKDSAMPLLTMSIGDYFDQQVNLFANEVAIIFEKNELLNIEKTNWTYERYHREVQTLAKGLLHKGFIKGQHIAVWSINRPEWIILQFACAKIGLVLITLNPALRRDEIKYLLQKSDATAIFINSSFAGRDFLEEALVIQQELPTLKQIITLDRKVNPAIYCIADYQKIGSNNLDKELLAVQQTITSQAIFEIQFTSGTTGFPKGALLTHFNAINNAYLSMNYWRLNAKDVFYSPLPLFHTAGSILGLIGVLSKGATYLSQPFFQATEAIELLEKNKATIMSGVPTMLQAILQQLQAMNKKMNIPLFISGGAPVPQVLMEQLEFQVNSIGVVLMGMTETSPVFSATCKEDSQEKRYITSGKALPYTSIRIVNPQSGEVIKQNEVGEIEVSGYMVMKSYYRDVEETKKVLSEDGWLKTGDLGILDTDGYLNVIGRLKDLIIRGGENIFPREVEDFLLTCTSIEEVQVLGIPDEYYGEVLVAYIKTFDKTLNVHKVKKYCEEKISHQKIPTYIFFIDEFPKTASGKIMKKVLRDQAIKKIAENEVEKNDV